MDFLGLKNRDDLVQKTWVVPENNGPEHVVPAKPVKVKYKVAKGKVVKTKDDLVDALVEVVKGLDGVTIDHGEEEPAKQVNTVD